MTLNSKIAHFALAGALALGLAGNAVADSRTTNTIVGAGIGAAAGAVLSGGDPLATLGGAAAGGVVGNIISVDGRHYRDDRRYRRHYDPPRYYRTPPRVYYDGPRYVYTPPVRVYGPPVYYEAPRYRHRPPGWDRPHWKHSRHYDGPRHRGHRHHHR